MSAYLLHLAQANEIQPVFTKVDICSEQGEVLIPEGSPIDQDAVKALAEQKLHKKIETCIRLEEEFTGDFIYELLTTFVLNDPATAELYQARDLNDKFSKCVEAFAEHDTLRQKLNILAIQIPEVFDQALFCGWMAVTVLASENYPQHKLNNAFIAALSHDLGLLNIMPEILFKTEPLSPEEWEAMQQHPAFSAKLMKEIEGIDKECIRAVLEHHESPDGGGYPKGKFAKQLGDLGQLLYVLDSLNAIYRKHFKTRQRSLHDTLPIIQMTTLSRGGVHTNTLASILHSTSTTEHCAIEAELIPAATDLVKANAAEITQFILVTSQFTLDVGAQHKDLHLLGLQNIARLIRTTLISCGIINDAYLRWLDQVSEEKLDFAYRELEDVLLMTQEIKFHIQRFHRQIAIYISRSEQGELAQKATALQAEVDKIPQAQIAESALIAYLQGQVVD